MTAAFVDTLLHTASLKETQCNNTLGAEQTNELHSVNTHYTAVYDTYFRIAITTILYLNFLFFLSFFSLCHIYSLTHLSWHLNGTTSPVGRRSPVSSLPKSRSNISIWKCYYHLQYYHFIRINNFGVNLSFGSTDLLFISGWAHHRECTVYMVASAELKAP